MLKEYYLIPALEDMLQDLNSSTLFNHLDFNLAYNQTELASESGATTAFQTYQGMFQYQGLEQIVHLECFRKLSSACAPELSRSVKFLW
jgi:hypothetical protein